MCQRSNHLCSVPVGAGGLFTCPAVIFPDGTYLMDSKAIAPAIEKRYPSPALRLESPIDEKARDAVIRAMTELRPVYVTQVPKKFLSDASVPFFRESRAKDVGKSLDEWEVENPKDEAFTKASPALKDLAALLAQDTKGPFLEGEQVIYMDFIVTGVLIFFRRMGDDIWRDFLKATGNPEVYERYLEAMSPWTKRDSH